ncbi:MAG: hypothetical protein QW114_02660 [Candidatus Nezhaarchaeales archaeon]
MSNPYNYLFLICVFLALASVPWYFRMRRRIALMKKVTEDLEKTLKPKDKEYVLLGYLVDYKAKYTLNGGDKVYVVFTTAPKHSMLYYPILKAFKRKDRLTLAIEYGRRHVSSGFTWLTLRIEEPDPYWLGT